MTEFFHFKLRCVFLDCYYSLSVVKDKNLKLKSTILMLIWSGWILNNPNILQKKKKYIPSFIASFKALISCLKRCAIILIMLFDWLKIEICVDSWTWCSVIDSSTYIIICWIRWQWVCVEFHNWRTLVLDPL